MKLYRKGIALRRPRRRYRLSTRYRVGEEKKPRGKPLWKELIVFLPAILIPIGLWRSDQALARGGR